MKWWSKTSLAKTNDNDTLVNLGQTMHDLSISGGGIAPRCCILGNRSYALAPKKYMDQRPKTEVQPFFDHVVPQVQCPPIADARGAAIPVCVVRQMTLIDACVNTLAVTVAQRDWRMPSRNTTAIMLCIILLAGLPNQEALDSTKIKVIAHLDCFIRKGGYNIKSGGKGVGAGGIKGKKRSEQTKKRISENCRGKKGGAKKAVVITIIRTGTEIQHLSVGDAATAMCVSMGPISKLARKKMKKSRCKSGEYANGWFTVRY